ncbi:MAG: apolipoprotein N-acyltransferase, partial [Chlamydiae bacterium]|nr:apolipoprotein N-acyltransferase [Chlamydiota bacterium]
FLTSLWILFEWMRLQILCGFAFNFVGILLSGNLLSLQMASLSGVLGLSCWVILTNLIGFRVLRLGCGKKMWCFFLVFPYLFGGVHLAYQECQKRQSSSREKAYEVWLLQPELLPSQKYLLQGREQEFIPPLHQWKRMLEWVVQQRNTQADLIVFPEAVVPFGLTQCIYEKESVDALFASLFGQEVYQSFPHQVRLKQVSNAYIVQTLANFLQAAVVIGLDHHQQGEGFYNSAFYFEPDNPVFQRYDKRILLPLAESMPLPSLSFLSRYYGISDFFTPGRKAELFSPHRFCLSPSICYEELFPALMREGRLKGAQLFVNLSSDAWYPFSRLAKQHFTHGLIRAVENGVPLVRACNAGVTAAIDSSGRILAQVCGGGAAGLKVQVSAHTHRTGFVIWGELPLLSLCCLCVISNIFLFFRKKNRA